MISAKTLLTTLQKRVLLIEDDLRARRHNPLWRVGPTADAAKALLPWLKQWHNAFNPDFSSGLGDDFAGFIDEEARKQGTTVEGLNQMRLGSHAES
jgi:hypothetical protein